MQKNIEIVIIEDEEDILELIEYHLGKEGYSVTGFLSTENVEQFLEEETPALMLVDRNLPGMEGSEFVAYLRGMGYDVPVIFLTAKDQESELEEGFNSFIRSIGGLTDDVEIESEKQMIESIKKSERIRCLNPRNISATLYETLANEAIYIAREPFVANGRVELMHYFIEQSISDSYHRYGNLGARGIDKQ